MARDFYTFRGYSLQDAKEKERLTPGMEDYLEMIYRLAASDGYTRMLALAAVLHVRPPSASRMVQRLAEEGFVLYERYGIIRLTEQGRLIGEYLLSRHDVLEQFLGLIGVREALEDAERIEHNVSDRAMSGIKILVQFFKDNPEIRRFWDRYLEHGHGTIGPGRQPRAGPYGVRP